MAHTQAQHFDANWQVLAQQDLSDGFSAVLFQQVDAQGNPFGEKVLAIRGTEASHRGLDYFTDVVNIALLGTSVGMPQYNSLESFYQTLVAQGKLTATENITVTGHSLGGFLAQAFTAKHDSVVSAAYTYNSPGFSTATGVLSGIGTELLEFFGITDASIPSSKIFNVRATDGISATSGLGQMIGYVQGITIESSVDPVHNHSITTLTDALALYAAYVQIDPAANVASITNILKASGNQNSTTLETALDNLRELIFGDTTPSTVLEDRESFYTNLYQLTGWLKDRTGPALKLDALTSYSGTDIASKAQANTPDGLAYRYALTELNPFALTGDDGLYAQHNANGELDLYDPASGTGTLTGLYLQDRAAMLSWKTRIAIEDQADNLAPYYTDTYYFKDQASGAQVWLDDPLYFNPAANDGRIQILFGESGTDILAGGSRSDHLYGGLGYDALSGGAGNDYLEGNGGADVLKGETGYDTLLGGEGNDALTGGAGNDRLEGGQGADTYQFTSGDGWDWVEDSDGAGHIEYDGLILGSTPLENKAPNVWQQTAGGKTFTYSLYTRGEGGETYPCLSILGPGGGLWVKRWQAGQLGIALPGAEPANPPASTLTLAGDLEPAVDANGATMVDSLDNLVVSGLAAPGRSDTLYDSTGNDLIQGLGGDDLLFAFRGGADTLEGGSGNDLASGDIGHDWIDGNTGNDTEWRMAA